tara:strand:- start:183 stop:878 length:696 start_codon:yes stop_codon:yes gene_type:complete
MPRIRLYLKKNISKDEKIELSTHHFHYLKNVMRKKEDDKILIFNDTEEWFAKILSENYLLPFEFSRKKINKENIWIYFSLIKKKNINYLIEKVSEIGVEKIIPIETDFSERISIKIDRLNKIIIEAVEQSNSLVIPELSNPVNLKSTLSNWDNNRTIILCDEKYEINNHIKLSREKKLAIFIGPIGGWSDKERILFDRINHIKLSLGENILKADTAAILALSKVKGSFYDR